MQYTLSLDTLSRAIRRAWRPGLACGLLPAMLVLTAAPAAAQLSGVSYTLSPTYNVLRWDNDLGLEDTELYGGRLGLNFGRYLGLQGYYLARNDVNTRVSDLDIRDGAGASLLDRELDIQNYGVDLVLALSRGPVVPFLKAGGGVYRFDGPDIDPMRQVNLKAGGGVRFGISRFKGEVYVEDSALRIDRHRLGVPVNENLPLPRDPESEKLWNNLSLGASLTFFLGGYDGDGETEVDRAIADRYQSGLSGLSIPVEPFVGRLDYNSDLSLENQELVGLRTGIDLGRLVGLRAYYWRGVNEDLDDTEPVQSYGGEVQLNLSSGQGLVPYVVAGVGELDYLSSFRDESGEPRSDKTMLILGGGVGLPLGDRLRLEASARDYILSETAAENVTTTDELYSNWMFSAGIRFSLGGGDGRSRPLPEDPMPPMSVVPPTAEASPVTGAPTEPPPTPGEAPVPAEWTVTDGKLPPTRNYQGDRIIAIPVPTEGEIYIRYGRPGGVNIESRSTSTDAPPAAAPEGAATPASGAEAPPSTQAGEDAIREAIRAELAAAGLTRQPPAPAGDLAQMEERLARRIDGRMDRIETEIRSLRGAVPEGGRTVVITDDTGQTVSGDTEIRFEEKPYSWSPAAVRAYTGLNVDDPTQGLVGAKLDMGPVTRHSDFHFLPELAVGFGSDVTTVMAAGSLEYYFREVTERGSWSPLVGVGIGIMNFNSNGDNHSEGVLNLNYGVTANLGRWVVFAEHQGVDLFDLNRLLFGLRLAL